MKTTTFWLMASIVLVPSLAMSQDRGSAEDQLACTPDVYRLCSQNIPDEDAIVACLRQHKAQLSSGCKVVFSRPETAPPPKATDDD